jgi:preprotein translocase subunit SecG
MYIAARAASAGLTNYRVIYLLLTRAIAWFATLYLAAGLFVTFNRRRPEPLAET